MGRWRSTVEADTDWYNPPPGTDRGGHVVVIVGYHDNLPGENAPGGGYWIIKNSWGSGDGWNGNGYGEIAYASRPELLRLVMAGDLQQ